MKYEIINQRDASYFLIRLSGQFSLDDLETCYVEIVSNNQWQPGGDIVWDARECTFDHLKREDLTLIGKMTLKYKNQRGKGKAAWVVGRDIDFAVSRMFEMLNEESVIFDFQVFRTLENAVHFIADISE